MKPFRTAIASVWLVPILAVSLIASAIIAMLAWPFIPFAIYYFEKNKTP